MMGTGRRIVKVKQSFIGQDEQNIKQRMTSRRAMLHESRHQLQGGSVNFQCDWLGNMHAVEFTAVHIIFSVIHPVRYH
mgnify:CR=1 FL=1